MTAALLLLSLGLSPATLRVRVTDGQDAAIAGAVVEFRSAGGGAAAAVRSGADGFAVAEMTPPVRVTVRAAGFSPASIDLAEAPGAVVTVRLAPAIVKTSLEVVVRDDTASAPLIGTAAEIARTGARTVFDAVERLAPSVSVTRRGVMGYGIATNGTGGISIRGVGEQPNTGVLIVVDGRPDFQGLMGHPLPDFYSLSDASSVSVTQGPASVLYGSNAMGGVIEIKSAPPAEGLTTRLTSSLGSFLTGQQRLAQSFRRKRLYYSLAAGVSHTAGERAGSAFRDQDGTLALGYDLSRSWKASLESRYGHFHVEDPGPMDAPLSNSYARVGRGGFTLNLDNAAGRTWGYGRVYASRGKHLLSDGFRSVDAATGVRVDQSFALSPRLVVEAGSDVVSYGGRAAQYGEFGLTSAAGFSRVQWSPAARLRLNSGIRFERNSLFGGIVAPEAGMRFDLARYYSIAVEIGRGYRNPTIRELYLFPAPNPALRPERLWNYQATFQARPADSISASATFYYASLTNLIITTGRFPNVALGNAGEAVNRGWEASARWRPRRRLAFQSGYAWLRSSNLAPYVPARKWNFSAAWSVRRLFVDFGGAHVSERWGDARRARSLAPYTLGTLRLALPLSGRCSFFTTIDNLFNRRYEVVTGYPMPRLNAAAGVALEF